MSTRPRRRADARPPLRVVAGRDRRRLAFVPLAVVVVLAVFAVAGLQAYLGQEGFRADRLERRLAEAEEHQDLLRARLAELSSPARIESAAAALGMVPAPQPVFLPAPDGMPEGSLGSRTSEFRPGGR